MPRPAQVSEPEAPRQERVSRHRHTMVQGNGHLGVTSAVGSCSTCRPVHRNFRLINGSDQAAQILAVGECDRCKFKSDVHAAHHKALARLATRRI